MLKSTVRTKNGIDIKSYSKLTAFLKQRSDGCMGLKSLSRNDVEKFIKEAPDSQYLVTKVALIFAITGGCRRQELCSIITNDIENHGQMLLVRKTNKNKILRPFAIHGHYYEIVKKYQGLRSNNAKSDRFFQNYQRGKCTSQPIGINKFGAMPKEIAKFLGLPDADSYTGHTFKRISNAMLTDAGADTLNQPTRHGGRGSDAAAESDFEDSVQNKTEDSANITQGLKLEPSDQNDVQHTFYYNN